MKKSLLFIIVSHTFHELPGGDFYSIHPDALKFLLESSLKRLRTTYVDGFFLHNPHYLINTLDFEQTLANAFEFLEDMAKKGKIRYYGISSTGLNIHHQNLLSLEKIDHIANKVASSHRLKLFQIPFNMLENSAFTNYKNGMNLIDYCHSKACKVFGNRPFNAYLPNGKFVRLAGAKFTDTINKPDFDELVLKIEETLQNQEYANYVQHLLKFSNNWKDLPSTEFVASYFYNCFNLSKLETDRRSKVEPLFERLKQLCLVKANENMSRLTELFYANYFPGIDLKSEEYAGIAIKYCQLKGIDCVLAGLRREVYLKNIENLIRN